MKDSPERRNRIAAIVVNYWSGELTYGLSQTTTNLPKTVHAESVQRIFASVLAALAGQTSPDVLRVDPASTPALQIAYLCQDPT